MHIFDEFKGSIDKRWIQVSTGGGTINTLRSKLQIGFESAQQGQYTDAQIDDYTMLSKSSYPWRPPLTMTVRARSSLPAASIHDTTENKAVLQGTAGFGFWNNPFSVQGKFLTLPEAVWFFYASPPSNVALVPGVSGWGWKAQVIHTVRPGAIVNAIPASIDMAYRKITNKAQSASRWMQGMTGAQEALLTVNMTSWHTYKLKWEKNEAVFWVDKKRVLCVPHAPTRPLGFVVWIDNQYAIATPNGILKFGTIDSGSQYLEIDYIKIQSI